MMQVKNLNCGYGNKTILRNVNFTARPGDFICILGPNGAGKTTLLKSILNLIKPLRGKIVVDKEDIADWNWQKRARKFSYIPQSFGSAFQYLSMDIVLMGRTPYLNLVSSPREEDERLAIEAMERLNILHLKDKIYSQLSGGERQLVKIAQTLVQQATIILMDEPTSNLDFSNQMIIMKHLKDETAGGKTVIMATHHPEQAFLYGTTALLVKGGEVSEIRDPMENLKEEHLKELYGIDLQILKVGPAGRQVKICLPTF